MVLHVVPVQQLAVVRELLDGWSVPVVRSINPVGYIPNDRLLICPSDSFAIKSMTLRSSCQLDQRKTARTHRILARGGSIARARTHRILARRRCRGVASSFVALFVVVSPPDASLLRHLFLPSREGRLVMPSRHHECSINVDSSYIK